MAYFDSSIPEEKRMPLAPHRSLPLRPDDYYRSTTRTPMQPTYSMGSKESVIWISSWLQPALPMPKPKAVDWSYQPALSSETLFPMPEWKSHQRLQSRTLRIPYWTVIPAYLICWSVFMLWSGRRLRIREALMGAAAVPAN